MPAPLRPRTTHRSPSRDRPRHLVEDRRRPPADRHGLQVEHVGHGHDPNRLARPLTPAAGVPGRSAVGWVTSYRWSGGPRPWSCPAPSSSPSGWPTTAPTARSLRRRACRPTTSRTPCSVGRRRRPRCVDDVTDEPLSALLDACAGGPRDVAAVLPVPGDPGATPASVSAAATEAGEAVLVRTAAGVPRRGARWCSEFGSALEPGHLVTWEVADVADWRHAVHAQIGVAAGRRARPAPGRSLQATEALVALDVARGGPTPPRRSRRCATLELPAWRLPDGLDGAARAGAGQRGPPAGDRRARHAGRRRARSTCGRPTSARPRCARSTGWPAARWPRRRSPG